MQQQRACCCRSRLKRGKKEEHSCSFRVRARWIIDCRSLLLIILHSTNTQKETAHYQSSRRTSTWSAVPIELAWWWKRPRTCEPYTVYRDACVGLGALGRDSFHLNERGLLFLILLSWNKSWNKGFLLINRQTPTRVGSTNDETKRGLSRPWSFSQFFLAHRLWNRASLSLSTGLAKILTMYSSIALFNSSGEWDVSNLLESLNPRLRVVFFFSYFSSFKANCFEGFQVEW